MGISLHFKLKMGSEIGQPSRHVRRKGAASPSGEEEQTAHAYGAYMWCACLLSSQMDV